MEKAVLQHMHADLEELKKSVAIMVYILSEEGKLTEEAKKRLEKARQTPDAEYTKLN